MGDLYALSEKVADSFDLEQAIRSMYEWYAKRFDQELIDIALKSGVKQEDFEDFVSLVWRKVGRRLGRRLRIRET